MSAPRRRRPDLAAAAVRLAGLLGLDECVLIGGLAVGVHGYVRATDDLDFISRLSLAVTRERLRKAGLETRLLRGDILDGGFSCLKGEIDGIPFDVLPPLVPIAWDRALHLDIGGGSLKVVDLDGLLQLKFRAGGPQDLLDATRLVMLHPETEARARELATAYRLLDRLEAWLRDPRIRAQAARKPSAKGGGRRRLHGDGAGPRLDPSAAPCFHEGDGALAPDARRRAGRPGPRGRAAGPVRLCAGPLGVAARRRARVLRAARRRQRCRRRLLRRVAGARGSAGSPRPLPPTPSRWRSPPFPSPRPPCSARSRVPRSRSPCRLPPPSCASDPARRGRGVPALVTACAARRPLARLLAVRLRPWVRSQVRWNREVHSSRRASFGRGRGRGVRAA